MRANQIQASVPAPVASLPLREPMSSVHFSMAIDTSAKRPRREVVGPPIVAGFRSYRPQGRALHMRRVEMKRFPAPVRSAW